MDSDKEKLQENSYTAGLESHQADPSERKKQFLKRCLNNDKTCPWQTNMLAVMEEDLQL